MTLPATSAVIFQKIKCTNVFFKCHRLCNGSEEQLHILGAALLSVGWMVGGIVYCNFSASMLHFLHLSETGEKSACSDKSKTMRQLNGPGFSGDWSSKINITLYVKW